MPRSLRFLALAAAAQFAWVACGSSAEDGSPSTIATGGSVSSGGSNGSGASPGSGGVTLPSIGGTANLGGEGGVVGDVEIITTLPDGFTAAEGPAEPGEDDEPPRGGYRIVGPLSETEAPESEACANVLRVVVRDFVIFGHPDFGGSRDPSNAEGLVLDVLGEDRKPVRSEAYPSVSSAFDDWYNNVEGVNVPYLMELWLEPVDDTFVFDSSRFFPLDEVEPDEEFRNDSDRRPRNFGFTTELHTKFEYKGGERFTFRGDDDVFVFIDGKLVVDLGGVHNPVEGSVDVDDLGLTLGSVYTFDLFQAERNPVGSNFRIETTLDFTECGEVLPDDIIR